MKIFMDTANVEEIREFADMGIVYGVTTNPSLTVADCQVRTYTGGSDSGNLRADSRTRKRRSYQPGLRRHGKRGQGTGENRG